jgi:glucose/mannose-6-phosphate isomerase
LRSLVEREGPCHVHVSRHYEPPHWLAEDDFLVFSSYSGETEETLAAYDALRGRAPRSCVLTTGGTLAQWARRDGVPMVTLPGGMPPRAALGYSFSVLATVAGHLGLLADAVARLTHAADEAMWLASACGPNVVFSRNPAKQLAIRLAGRAIILIANERTLYPAALRWKGQLNENAKHLAWASPLPEMNHNEVDGFVNPAGVVPRLAAVLFSDPEDHPRIARRLAWLRGYLKRRGVRVETVAAVGEDSMDRLVRSVLLGDFVSYFLALKDGADPSALPGVEALKRALRA